MSLYWAFISFYKQSDKISGQQSPPSPTHSPKTTKPELDNLMKMSLAFLHINIPPPWIPYLCKNTEVWLDFVSK